MRRLSSLLWVLCLPAQVPTPTQHLGYTPGDPYKLADYRDVVTYFQKLAAASDRMRLVEFGRSSLGKPMYMAIISDSGNLAQIARYRSLVRRLALGQAEPEEARRLAQEGKAVVWIDSGLHASEVAPVQHSFDLAYRMVTAEDEETRRIRRNVILLQIPVINPDGLDWIAHWYRQNVGTPYELAPLPHLYQKYAGHDNNRDYFMLNLDETRHVSRQLFEEWFPHIVYNQHQQPAFPARIFVPPYAEPLNPHIPAPIMEGINLIGSAMKERFAREDKPGVLSYFGFDGWWNGGLRSVPAFHNMHGILTETAAYHYGTPGNYNPKDLPERFANGIPTREPSIFYQRPWLGGKWTVRDAIDYMLTADFAILNLAAERPAHFLFKSWELARASIEQGAKGSPYAYLVPAEQWDNSAAADMVRRLHRAGVQIHRLGAPLMVEERTYPVGTWVMLASQPFRPYLVDLMEPQRYPEIRTGSDGATRRPYDIAGWTLWMHMGVEVKRIDAPFTATLEPVTTIELPAPSRRHRDNSFFLALAEELSRKPAVNWNAAGDLAESDARWEIRRPRVALYQSHTANMDAGWTEYLLDQYRIPHTLLKNDQFAAGDLRSRFDALILASQSVPSILHGSRPGESSSSGPARGAAAPILQRPEFTGGIGLTGLLALDTFVRRGGTLIAFDEATQLPVQFFPLPLRSVIAAPYSSPGSLLRIQVETGEPLALGMPNQTHAFTTGGHAWDITLANDYNKGDREVRSVARYAASGLLASGWLAGERVVAGKHVLVEARHGEGRVVLFGFRPQFRAQSAGTFKFLLNAIYLSAAKKL